MVIKFFLFFVFSVFYVERQWNGVNVIKLIVGNLNVQTVSIHSYGGFSLSLLLGLEVDLL